jgi:hypothetical protein
MVRCAVRSQAKAGGPGRLFVLSRRTAALISVGLPALVAAVAVLGAGRSCQRVERADPPGAAPPGALVLFNGKDLDGWVTKDGRPAPWKVENGYLEVIPGTGDILTREEFGDCRLHVEFWVPLMPDDHDQARGNSGIYIQSRYEVQILDSYNNPTYFAGECGALYGAIPVSQNACKPPEQWQTYDITFHHPRLDEAGRLTARGHISVVHNGVLVIDNGTFDQPTGAAKGSPLVPRAPVRLQDHGARVRFRTIWLRPLSES